MSMCQSPWNRRRLLSHQGRGGLGSAEGLVKRSTHWPISVHAGSQHGPHTTVYWKISAGAEEHRTQPVIHFHPSLWPLLQKGLSSSPTHHHHLSQIICPPLLTVEIMIELEWRHVPLDGHIAPRKPQRQDLAPPRAGLTALLSAHQSTHQPPVTDLKQVPGIVSYPHCQHREDTQWLPRKLSTCRPCFPLPLFLHLFHKVN